MSKSKRQVTLEDRTIAALEAEGFGTLSTGIEIMFRDWTQRGVATTVTRLAPHKPVVVEAPPSATKALPIPKPWEDEDRPPTDDETIAWVALQPPKLKKPDSRNPTGNTNRQGRLDHKDAMATMEKAEARTHALGSFKHAIEHHIIHRSGQHNYTGAMDAAEAAGLLPYELNHIVNDLLNDPQVKAEQARMDISRAEHLEAVRISNERHAAGMTLEESNTLNRLEFQKTNGITPPVQTLKLTEKARKAMNLMGTPETMEDWQIKETNEHYANHTAVEVLDEGEVLE